MKNGVFAVLRWLLFLLVCFFISLLELRFFDHAEVFSLPFALVFAATAAAFSFYYFAKKDTVFFYFYTIALLCALEITNRRPDFRPLLAAMFCMALLFAQSLFHENAGRMKEKRPPAASYFLTLVLVCAVSAAVTYLVFQYGLNRLENERRLYAVVNTQSVAQLQIEQPQDVQEQGKGEGGSGKEEKDAGEEKPPARLNLRHLALLLAVLFAGILGFFLLRCVWRRFARWLWMRKTLSSPPESMVLRLYPYFLWILECGGYAREPRETPYEYLRRLPETEAPILKEQFARITDLFVSVYYGRRQVSREACRVYLDVCAQIRKSRIRPKRQNFWHSDLRGRRMTMN